MMMLILAPKSTKGIKENLLQTHGWKIRQKYSKNHEKEKWSIQLGDKIHTQRSTILGESNVYKVWNYHNILPLFRRLEGSLTLSPLLCYTMKHIHTSQKATMARGWERDDWVLTSLPALRVTIIGKLMIKQSLWPNAMKMTKLG
jgi:hypothetical protein